MSMSWNLSQISREIISRGVNPVCESEQFGVYKAGRYIRTKAKHDFYLAPKCCLFQWIFSLTGKLCSGGVYILPEQTMLPLVSCWEVVTSILILLKILLFLTHLRSRYPFLDIYKSFWGGSSFLGLRSSFSTLLSDARASSLTSFET